MGILLIATPCHAQWAVSASAGASAYDLSGVGTSGVAALRMERRVGGFLGGQLGSAFFWYRTQGDRDVAMLLPEAGVVAHLPVGIPLLMTVGAGYTIGVKGGGDDHPTLHAALALDIEDRGGWAIRPEVRLRTVDPWAGTMADLTLGVRRTHREIIRAGTINITENTTRSPGDVGPTGVCRSIMLCNFPGLMSRK